MFPRTPDRKANAVYVLRFIFLFHYPKNSSSPLNLGNLSQTTESRAHSSSGRGAVAQMLALFIGRVCRPTASSSTSFLSLSPGRRAVVAGFVDVRNGVGTTGHGALARAAVPDAGGLAANSDLAAESAGVLGVLADFHLLDLLTQRSTVAAGRKLVSVDRRSLSSMLDSIQGSRNVSLNRKLCVQVRQSACSMPFMSTRFCRFAHHFDTRPSSQRSRGTKHCTFQASLGT